MSEEMNKFTREEHTNMACMVYIFYLYVFHTNICSGSNYDKEFTSDSGWCNK